VSYAKRIKDLKPGVEFDNEDFAAAFMAGYGFALGDASLIAADADLRVGVLVDDVRTLRDALQEYREKLADLDSILRTAVDAT